MYKYKFGRKQATGHARVVVSHDHITFLVPSSTIALVFIYYVFKVELNISKNCVSFE